MKGQVRKVSPGGASILKREFNFESKNADSYNWGEPIVYKLPSGKKVIQNFYSIAVDADHYIYALDSAYGKIYVYDRSCRSVTVIGGGAGQGMQAGTFTNPISVEVIGTDILVSDSEKKSITVFKRTDYGEKLFHANTMTLNGEYQKSEQAWMNVLSISQSSQLTYRGLVKAAIAKGDYSNAMYYARLGLDQESYSIAFNHRMNQYLEDNFWWIFLLVVLILAGIVAYRIWAKKSGFVLIKNAEIRLAGHALFHPMDTFYSVKYRQQGSVMIAAAFMLLLFVLKMAGQLWGGFMYVSPDPNSVNSLLVLAGTVGLALLWVVSNWLISSLMEGKGSFREIFIITGYSLIPMLIYYAVFFVVSHFMVPSAVSALDVFKIICYIAMAAILACGLIQIHEFEMRNVIKATLITVLSILLIIFILFVVYTLLQSFIGFIINVYSEIVLR